MIRSRVAALVLVLAGFSLLGLHRMRHQPAESVLRMPAPASEARSVDEVTATAMARRAPSTGVTSMAAPTASAALAGDSPAELVQAYVDRRIIELNELAMYDDPISLETILSELENREPRIRKAALEAAIQFGDRSAIPRLQEVADQTADPLEKADLLKGVEFLKLPHLGEALAQTSAEDDP